MKTIRQFVMEKIHAGASTYAELKKLAERAGHNPKSVSPTVTIMVQNGQLVRPARGQYTLPPNPRVVGRSFAQIAKISTATGESYRLIDVADFLGVSDVNEYRSLIPAGEIHNYGMGLAEQNGEYVTRTGLNRLLLHSRSGHAKEFRDWLGNEVMESVHETGMFDAEDREDPIIKMGLAIAHIGKELKSLNRKIEANRAEQTTVNTQIAGRVGGLEKEVRKPTAGELEALHNHFKMITKGRQEKQKLQLGFSADYEQLLRDVIREASAVVAKNRIQDYTCADVDSLHSWARRMNGEAWSHSERKNPKYKPDPDYQVN